MSIPAGTYRILLGEEIVTLPGLGQPIMLDVIGEGAQEWIVEPHDESSVKIRSRMYPEHYLAAQREPEGFKPFTGVICTTDGFPWSITPFNDGQFSLSVSENLIFGPSPAAISRRPVVLLPAQAFVVAGRISCKFERL